MGDDPEKTGVSFTKPLPSANLAHCISNTIESRFRSTKMNISAQQLSTFEFELFKKYSSHDILSIAEIWKSRILDFTSVKRVEISGELRRGRPTISHIDIVVSSHNIPQTIKEIEKMAGIQSFQKRSSNLLELRLSNDIPLLVWLTIPISFATALLYTTGPSSHTDWLNAIAIANNKQVTFHGCWQDKHLLDIGSEEEIYQLLRLPYFPPEIREIEFSQENISDFNFRNLITQADIRSDLHTHSDWSDGKSSLEEMVCAALIRNLSLIAITDHSPHLMQPRYTDSAYFFKQHEQIDELNEKYHHQIAILKGVEVDILPDGSLDLPVEVLRTMDIVVASLHVELDQPRSVITERLIRAIENPFVDIIGHPGGRLFPMHDIADLDWDRVYRAAAFNQVALEINSHKAHPIFDDQKVRAAVGAGVSICLNSDAHATSKLDQSIFGINIARRAGLSKSQVINTWSPNHLKIWLKRRSKLIAAGR